MVGTVKSRPNHYETLGLKPTANAEEIAAAFARQMRLSHPVSTVAQIGIAFDTLRHPAKRRAYDETLGIRAEPEPRFVPPAISFRASARFAGLAPIAAKEPATDRSPKPALPLTGAPEAAIEDKPAPSAAGLPALEPRREPPPRPQAPAQTSELPDFLAGAGAGPRFRPDDDDRVSDWRKPVLFIGSLVLIVVVVSAWAGAHAQDPGEPQSAKEGLTVALPAARPHPASAASAPVQAVEAQSSAAAPDAVRLVRRSRAPTPPRTQASTDRLADIGQSLEAQETASLDGGGQEAAAETQASGAAASLPLSKAVIARTIHRIGYSCGEVASATAVDGQAPGVYKITCTSGQSYQAKPVRGRYHFRRW
jgi:curved DNA-binding protein CbpA